MLDKLDAYTYAHTNNTEDEFDDLFDLFHHHFTVDKRTCDLYWRVPTTGRVKRGDPAGYVGKNGIIRVGFYSEVYKVHRVVYFMETGEWPMLGRDSREHIIGSLNNKPPQRRVA